MTDIVELLVRGTVIGIGGAALMDVWAWLARRAFDVRGLDYALLGRWIGHLAKGRIAHDRIAAAAPIPGERPLGWLAHYAIGAAFAILLLLVAGTSWATAPSLGPAMALGFGTILAPWLVMQPAMGAGIAGSRTPDPRATRLRNLAVHAVYGAGVFATAWVLSVIWR